VTVLAGKRILVVEDEMLIAALLEDMLLELGATVLGPAASVAEGVRLAEAGTFDAAVLDVNVRGDRIDPVSAVLRQRRIPMVFATGYGEDAMAHGPSDPVLDKPYTRERLARALLRCLAAK
jgi:CheY-like chemotaxis protein